jgi:hypothetical protein
MHGEVTSNNQTNYQRTMELTTNKFLKIHDIIKFNENDRLPKYKKWGSSVIKRFLTKYILPRMRFTESQRLPCWTIVFGTNNILTHKSIRDSEVIASIYIVSFDNIILYLQPKYEETITQEFNSLFQMFDFLYERINLCCSRYDIGPYEIQDETSPHFEYMSNVSWYFGNEIIYLSGNYYKSLINTEPQEIIYTLLCGIDDYYTKNDNILYDEVIEEDFL